MTGIVTWASAAVIILVFFLFGWEEVKLYRIKEAIKKLLESNNVLDSIKETKIAELGEKYNESINIETEDVKKTNIPAFTPQNPSCAGIPTSCATSLPTACWMSA